VYDRIFYKLILSFNFYKGHQNAGDSMATFTGSRETLGKRLDGLHYPTSGGIGM
jgi:hypothetical protein